MKKKISLILLTVALLFGLSSCEVLDMFKTKYRVSFYNDGSLVKEEEVLENTLIKAPNIEAKEGYNFLGWVKDLSDISTMWDFNNDVVKGNLRLDAYFELDINYLTVMNLRINNNSLVWDEIEDATYKITFMDKEVILSDNEFSLVDYKDVLNEEKTFQVEPIKEGFTGLITEGKVKYKNISVNDAYNLMFDEFDVTGFELNRTSFKTTTIDYEDHHLYVAEGRLTRIDEEPKTGAVALILRSGGVLQLNEGYENFYSLEFNLGNFQNRASTSKINVYVTNDLSLDGILVNSYSNENIEGFSNITIVKDDIKELVNLDEKVYFKLEAVIEGSGVNLIIDDLVVKETIPAYYEFTLKGQIGELSEYYQSVTGLKGKELIEELRVIISTNLNDIRYSDYKEIGEFADVNINDKSTVRGIYDQRDLKANWGSKSEWHREHVWPNSRLGMDRVKENGVNQGSDPHNLRAIYPSTNSSRSNRYYSNSTSNENTWTTLSDGMFYPGEDDIGDVARILMYMVVRYEFLGLTDNVTLLSGPAYTKEAAYMGKLSILLTWHNNDPVDEFEINRNEVIFTYQNNRNPFIDHPELFEEVFNYLISIDENRTVSITLYFEFEVNYSELTRKKEFLVN